MSSQTEPKGTQREPRAPKGSQGHPKRAKGTPKGAQWHPKGSQGHPRGSQREPKGTPKGAKGRPRAPKGSQRGPKPPQRKPKAHQRHPGQTKRTRSIFQTPDQPPQRTLCYSEIIIVTASGKRQDHLLAARARQVMFTCGKEISLRQALSVKQFKVWPQGLSSPKVWSQGLPEGARSLRT